MLAVSGTDGYKAHLKILNSRGTVQNNYSLDDGKFTQITYVKTNKSKISGLITGSDKGNLYIFPFPFYDRILD